MTVKPQSNLSKAMELRKAITEAKGVWVNDPSRANMVSLNTACDTYREFIKENAPRRKGRKLRIPSRTDLIRSL